MGSRMQRCKLCENLVSATNYSRHLKKCPRKSAAIFCEYCNKFVPDDHDCVKGKRWRCPICQKLKDKSHRKRHVQHCIQKKSPQTISQTPNLLSGNCFAPPNPPPPPNCCADANPTGNLNCDSSRLFGLRYRISGLQRDRKFPECELSKLNLLTEKHDLLWDTPALIQPSECWDKQFPSLEIFDAVRWSIQRLSLDCVCRAGQPIEREGWDWEISNALYQATMPLDSSDASGKSSLMNISLPEKFRRLRPSPTVSELEESAHDC